MGLRDSLSAAVRPELHGCTPSAMQLCNRYNRPELHGCIAHGVQPCNCLPPPATPSATTVQLRDALRGVARATGDATAVQPPGASDAWCWPHAEAMNGAELQTFAARERLFIRRGADEAVAENLADRLVIRDRQRDHRRTCLECQHYRHGRCGNRQRAGLQSAEIGRDLGSLLQHCHGFAPALDRASGRD